MLLPFRSPSQLGNGEDGVSQMVKEQHQRIAVFVCSRLWGWAPAMPESPLHRSIHRQLLFSFSMAESLWTTSVSCCRGFYSTVTRLQFAAGSLRLGDVDVSPNARTPNDTIVADNDDPLRLETAFCAAGTLLAGGAGLSVGSGAQGGKSGETEKLTCEGGREGDRV